MLLAIILLGSLSQAAHSPERPVIVVEARNRTAVGEFVQRMVNPGQGDQIPRWDGKLCSGVMGLERDQAEMVNDRIAQISHSIHLRSGAPGCKPSVLIVVTRDADAIAQAVTAQNPVSLRTGAGRSKIDQFRRPGQAVRWLAMTGDAGAANAKPIFDPLGRGTAVQSKDTAGYSEYATRLALPTRAVMSSMLVLVDSAAIGTVKLDALADYLTMVVLARPPLGAPPPSHSILSLFTDREQVRQLTTFDQDYLGAMYTTAPDVSSSSQASSIRARLIMRPRLRSISAATIP